MKFKIALTLFVATLLCSCQKDIIVQDDAAISTHQVDESHYFTPSAAYLATLDAYGRKPESALRSADCYWTEIPAGSTNALAQAINSACEGGVIYLKSGVHTENIALTITKSVKIIGETGAILKVKSAVTQFDTTGFNLPLKPALYFLNAPRSLVQDLDIQPILGDGSCAVVFENSNESAVMRCKISKFAYGVIVEKSDRMVIMRNTIAASTAWQTGDIAESEGIIIVNGKSAYISDNEITGSLTGIWPCDEFGTCERNNMHDNFLGMLLCNVPATSYLLPNGRSVGALIPTRYCKVRNNTSTDSQFGYLVIDGANRNVIENNNAARNALYDIELAGDSYRFGFFTPLSFENIFNAGNYPNIRVKDCGRNNRITGGVRINTTTDPCN
jgi:Periplasmic copper-binding protein (NosD)